MHAPQTLRGKPHWRVLQSIVMETKEDKMTEIYNLPPLAMKVWDGVGLYCPC